MTRIEEIEEYLTELKRLPLVYSGDLAFKAVCTLRGHISFLLAELAALDKEVEK